eukprot:gnl/TRDRNA2_/TRDRNA2_171777_c1_seq1.p1 gnl/TRDRNA2_/TRDRNA2_171777_c1~~gnl/TRDRNA2_/TRDRNA2_171777_c1_seq1.p1  ORF type:complete len:408 (-),score=20.23 gnl/TRDRNA2_/TRDRNA2_171777_c1_seq1:86-1309(-)
MLSYRSSSTLIRLVRLPSLGRYERDAATVCSLGDISLARLERRRDRLASFFSRQELPALQNIAAFGQTHALPVRAADLFPNKCAHPPSHAQLSYLAGFFDGDGCVTCTSVSRSGCELKVSQAADHAEVLFDFLRVFGGSIRNLSAAAGPRSACVQWVVGSQESRHAADMLHSFSSVKRPQLQIAAAWPKCSDERNAKHAELRRLKDTSQPTGVVRSWAYVAGFFDAEGCITVPAGSCSLTLFMAQKYRPVLDSISEFLNAESIPSKVCSRTTRESHTLYVSSNEHCRLVLIRMLDGGLLRKRRAADIALALSKQNHEYTRNELSRLAGNQGRYRLLDARGSAHSREVHNLRRRIRYWQEHEEVASHLQSKLNVLMRSHTMHKVAVHVERLRQDCRALLRQRQSLVVN